MKSLGVVIARFQCHEVTPAHANLLKEAMKENQRVVVMLGVHPVQRKRDPLDFPERFTMVWDWWVQNKPRAQTKDQQLDFLVVPLFDHPSDVEWAKNVDMQIAALALGGKVTLYCGPDGASTAYKKAGGKHNAVTVASYEQHATSVRAALLPRASEDYRAGVIVASERRFNSPFMCVDAFVVNDTGTHILLGSKHTDGGLKRLPGGFVDPQESLEHAVEREVEEEANIDVTDVAYMGSTVIDDWRYAGGPENILSACFYCIAKPGSQPRAKDDLTDVSWVMVDKVEDFFLRAVHSNHRYFVQLGLERMRTLGALTR